MPVRDLPKSCPGGSSPCCTRSRVNPAVARRETREKLLDFSHEPALLFHRLGRAPIAPCGLPAHSDQVSAHTLYGLACNSDNPAVRGCLADCVNAFASKMNCTLIPDILTRY